MSDNFEFDDKLHVERLSGTLHDPAATPGDVLTVQADGSVAAQPGGGSMPTGIILKTFTAAEIAAAWVDDYSLGGFPLPEIAETQWVAGYAEIANTLDQSVVTSGLYAYDAEASLEDVYDNGESLGSGLAATPGTYQTAIGWGVGGGAVHASFLASGKQAYILFTSSDLAAPTTGEITVAIFGS